MVYSSTNSPSIRPITSIGTPARPCFNIYKHYKYRSSLSGLKRTLSRARDEMCITSPLKKKRLRKYEALGDHALVWYCRFLGRTSTLITTDCLCKHTLEVCIHDSSRS